MYMHVNEEDNQYQANVNPKSGRACLNANLRKATRVIASFYADVMHDSALQGTQYTMLSAVSGFGKASINQLSGFLIMDQTTVTRAVKLLEQAGFVSVQKGKDRRQRIVELTKAGQEALETSYPMWLEAQTKVWEHLGDDKAKTLLELSEQIVDLYEKQ